MIIHYLKVAFRNLWRFKAYSFINLIGLASGMGVCLLVLIFVRYEQNYDGFYNKNTFRLCEVQQKEGDASPKKIAQTMFPMGPALKAEIPGIKEFVRIISWEKVPLQTEGKTAVMGTMYGTDSSFFRVFGLTLSRGDLSSALKEPNSIVLTEKLARKLFGDSDPMRQVVRNEGRDTANYIVTGILPDIPTQSHLQFDALYALSGYERPGWNKWDGEWAITYLVLNEHTDTKLVEQKFPDFLRKHISHADASHYQLFLQPLDQIHLYSVDITRDLLNAQKFDGSYLPLLIAVALFVLILGIINYINLSTARLLTRAKEVGVRKTSGAGWREIALQFFSETMVFAIIGFLVALALVVMLLPFIGRITQRAFQLSSLIEPAWIIIAACFVLGTGIMAGLFPAITMAGIRPVAVLKGKLWTSYRSPLRSALVIVQFTIAIGLSMATITAFRQLGYIRQYDLGFNKDAVIVIPVSSIDRKREERLMAQFRRVAGVRDVTGALSRLGNSLGRHEVIFQGSKENHTLYCSSMFIDFNYLSFYNISLLAGRTLSPKFGADRGGDFNGSSYIINETMARLLLRYSHDRDTSLQGLIGKGFRYGFQDSMGTIVGITHDFNFSSLHDRIEPVCMSYLHEYYFPDISVRMDNTKAAETISELERTWKDILPSQQFSYYFLDSYLQELYRSDTQTGIFIAIFTLVALGVSCLGLVGVAAFSIERRTKEIGIRKVLGATLGNIVFMLSKNFVRLVLISISIAIPIAWWAMYEWMQNFAYHTNISWWMFAAAAVLALLIAIVTVSFQAMRAAVANPVESLRLE